MHEKTIPSRSLCSSIGADNCPMEIYVARLSDHARLVNPADFPHRHHFYQIVLFTAGSGHHVIDFTGHRVAKHQVYFMRPGQVHTWAFESDVEGYLVNFNASFFTTVMNDPKYLEHFPIFAKTRNLAVCSLEEGCCGEMAEIFEKIYAEFQSVNAYKSDLLRAYLLQLIVGLSRSIPASDVGGIATQNHLVARFEEAIEENFRTKKLPKEYADLLFVTPNHLNAVCSSTLGKPAGELIRDRILLEAKRLLTNSTISISEVAYELNFTDNAYFSRFFKKYIGISPEQFRDL